MAVLLLHAFPLDETMWAPQRKALAGFDVVAPRLYGRGRSVDDWADSVLGEVDGDVTAVGASMGGYVALAMARRSPDRVRALLLAGSRGGPDSPERREVRDAMIALLREQGVEGYRAAAPFPLPDGLAAEELIGALELLRDRPDASPGIRQFARPFLLVVGRQDELLSIEEAREIAALAAHGRAEVVEGAGHIVSRDTPERFNELLLDFLVRVGEPRRDGGGAGGPRRPAARRRAS
ncbi:MAG: alpha/beta fold hydrolase [Thermoleophilia bacterium]|nr:alpha/beta fold hydrolase [Thermoleophilia bacterium]